MAQTTGENQLGGSNVVGPEVRRLRYAKGWTQEMLAARCTVCGVEITRGTLAKIEAGIRGVSDRELYVLTKTLRVEMPGLFPVPFKKAVGSPGRR